MKQLLNEQKSFSPSLCHPVQTESGPVSKTHSEPGKTLMMPKTLALTCVHNLAQSFLILKPFMAPKNKTTTLSDDH